MSDQSPAPSPAPEWEPPAADEEFIFESIDKAPSWVDKGWAGFDRGPALQVPAVDLPFTGNGPYTTKVARVGDKVVFTAAKGARGAHIDVIPGDPAPESGTKKVPQASNASLEDALKTGAMTPDDLGDDAKAQVIGRSPGLKGLVEEGKGAPDPQPVDTLLKMS